MTGYWNPLPTARRVVEDVGEKAEELFTGVWEQRNRRNVPGPFYAAETDSLALGRREAPDHIAYDDDLGGGFGFEFVYRQPVDAYQTENLIHGCRLELYRGYNWDGDDHWTVEAVRDWWLDRGRVREWAVAIAADWGADAHPPLGVQRRPGLPPALPRRGAGAPGLRRPHRRRAGGLPARLPLLARTAPRTARRRSPSPPPGVIVSAPFRGRPSPW
ncbi:hypothetical protein [Streptomyces sp. NPDC012450]|uniref:hypothetical protein n=1 Tax=Streptomyces sp. NPDC012450 TaxID=3364834 RepID=UPI0036E2C1BA